MTRAKTYVTLYLAL